MFLNATSPGNNAAIPVWLVIPFAVLIIMIAVGPLFFKSFWRQYYKIISVIAGIGVASLCVYLTGSFLTTEKTLFDFFSFMCLLSALYIVAGGIYIEADFKGTPFTNVILLLTGALLTNIIGTTGAAILLLRPFIRLNQHRMKPYLIVFFIFLICNIGGVLTPLGPPLILGFIKGVPFEWMMQNVIMEWAFTVVILLAIFLIIDSRNKSGNTLNFSATGALRISGSQNFFWLLLLIATVFLNPDQFQSLPTFRGHSFIRETLQILIAFLCFRTGNRKALQLNQFHFEPIKEVGFLFFGIFLTMIPALALLEDQVGQLDASLSPSLFFWSSGITSAVLDNAPAYLSFLTTAMSSFDLSINDASAVEAFSGRAETIPYLKAITLGTSFFGALTYIGNGPNFMVKAMCEDQGIKIPSFFGYIFKYSIPLLLPVLVLVWYLFIELQVLK